VQYVITNFELSGVHLKVIIHENEQILQKVVNNFHLKDSIQVDPATEDHLQAGQRAVSYRPTEQLPYMCWWHCSSYINHLG